MAHAHAVDDRVFLIVGVQVSEPEREVEREALAERQDVASGQPAAQKVALASRLGELVVEGAGLEHQAEVAAPRLTHIITHLGSHLPEGVAALLVVPRPRGPRAAYAQAPAVGDVPLQPEVGRQRRPAQQVDPQVEAHGAAFTLLGLFGRGGGSGSLLGGPACLFFCSAALFGGGPLGGKALLFGALRGLQTLGFGLLGSAAGCKLGLRRSGRDDEAHGDEVAFVGMVFVVKHSSVSPPRRIISVFTRLERVLAKARFSASEGCEVQ